MSNKTPAPPTDQVEEASLLLSLAARPVIWAGGGAVAAQASGELAQVAELLGAPVITSTSGKGAISEAHPLSLGSLFDAPEVARLLGQADAALAVGTTFSSRSTRKGQLPMPLQLFHIDLDPAVFSARYPARSGIEGNARTTLGSLADAVRSRPASPARQGAPERVAAVREAARTRLRAAQAPAVAALDALRAAIPDNVVTVWDVSPARRAVPLFWVPTPGTFVGPGPQSPPGAGFAEAAALGEPVVTVAAAHEVVAGRESLRRVSCIVAFPESLWAGSPRAGASDTTGPDGSGMAEVMEVAENLGLAVIEVAEQGELGRAVSEALASSGPTLLAVSARFG